MNCISCGKSAKRINTTTFACSDRACGKSFNTNPTAKKKVWATKSRVAHSKIEKLKNSVASSQAIQVAPQTTHVLLVTDHSGSMGEQGKGKAALTFVNEFIGSLQKKQEDNLRNTITLSHWMFSDSAQNVTLKQPVSAVTKMLGYQANGMTALRDGIGNAVSVGDRFPDKDSPNTSYLVMVVTDGMENASHEYHTQHLCDMIRMTQATKRWTYTFMSSSLEALTFAKSIGVGENNSLKFEDSKAGVTMAGARAIFGTDSYFVGREAGKTSTETFFVGVAAGSTPEMGGLRDFTSSFYSWTVPKAQDIQQFVISKGKEFKPGKSYYALTKTERRVQKYKKCLVRNNKTKRIWGDPSDGENTNSPIVRVFTGLPVDRDSSIRPKLANADYDVFVQSTSFNRALVKGTVLLYAK